MVTIDQIRRTARTVGLSGAALCVHSSLRSFGYVENGARTIVDGLLAEGCTLLVPTFTYDFAVAPPPGQRPPRNGTDYTRCNDAAPHGDVPSYIPTTNLIHRSNGALPAAVLAQSDRVRGDHPLNQFAAIGPLAHDLIDGQAPLDVYAPLRALASLHGSVILMGVGLTRMTLLHLAEQQAGRVLFRRWANDRTGQPMIVEVGSCSEGFGAFAPVLDPIVQFATVGASRWAIYPAQAVLERAVAAIRSDPLITRCGDPACERCDDAVAGGPIL